MAVSAADKKQDIKELPDTPLLHSTFVECICQISLQIANDWLVRIYTPL
jgi:hypothetical protein